MKDKIAKDLKFKIHDYNWSLSVIKKQTNCGDTDYSKCKITINSDLESQVILHSIIHEISHAYRWSYGYQNDADDKNLCGEQVEEEIANFMETWGDEIITLSKKLFNQYMTSTKIAVVDIKDVEVVEPKAEKKKKRVRLVESNTKEKKKDGRKRV